MDPVPSDLLRAWLIERVRDRNLSHAQLALRSGVDRSTIGRVLSGSRKPSFDTAVQLIRALDGSVLPDYLRAGVSLPEFKSAEGSSPNPDDPAG